MAIQFNLYWSYIGGNAGFPAVNIVGTQIPNVTEPYEHTGLDAGIEYFYVVTAYDTATVLESVASNELSGIPLNIPSTIGQIIW